jgi:hypothetical protein
MRVLQMVEMNDGMTFRSNKIDFSELMNEDKNVVISLGAAQLPVIYRGGPL